MWSSCHPKDEENLKECAELGKSLNRLSQPTILMLLAHSDEPLHGYVIVQQAANTPMFGGKKPDATGIYRALKRMEEAELVESRWETPNEGSAKRLFTLTDKGRNCLRRWIDALACYKLTIEELRVLASQSLGIDVPDTPVCAGHDVLSDTSLDAKSALLHPDGTVQHSDGSIQEPHEARKRTRKALKLDTQDSGSEAEM